MPIKHCPSLFSNANCWCYKWKIYGQKCLLYWPIVEVVTPLGHIVCENFLYYIIFCLVTKWISTKKILTECSHAFVRADVLTTLETKLIICDGHVCLLLAFNFSWIEAHPFNGETAKITYPLFSAKTELNLLIDSLTQNTYINVMVLLHIA